MAATAAEPTTPEMDPWYPSIYDAVSNVFLAIHPEDPAIVDLTDLQTVCAGMGVQLASHDLTQAMYDLDTSGEMVIRVADFAAWWLARLRAKEAAALAAQVVDTPTAARVWETVVDGETTYVYDTVTGESRWAMPELASAILAAFAREKEAGKRDDDDTTTTQESQLVRLFAKHDLARGPMETEVTYEQLQTWWFANVPQRQRTRLVELTEWWEVVDDVTKSVTYVNERTQVVQWDHPSVPAALVPIVAACHGTTLDEKLAAWFELLDQDKDEFLNLDEFLGMMTALLPSDVAAMTASQALAAMMVLQPAGDVRVLALDAILPWWQACHAKGLLGDWEEAYDADASSVYYYNWKTQQTQWENPGVTAHMQDLLNKFSNDPNVSTNERIRRLFVQYDTDQTGMLDAGEIKRICAALGTSLDAAALETMMRVMDTSGDGLVSLDEFLNWWHTKQHVEQHFEATVVERTRSEDIRHVCASYLHRAVGMFDATPIESNAVPRLVEALGRSIRGAALLRALHEMDSEGTRVIEPETFVVWYLKYDKACAEAEQRAREEKRAKEAMDTWVEQVNEKGSQTVYVNSRTKEIMWEKPGIQQRMQDLMQGSDIKAIFNEFDTDRSGSIDPRELKELLRALGQDVDEAQLRNIMTIIDTSGDGLVTLDELTTWWVCMQRRTIATANAQELQSQLINYHALSKDSIKELRTLFNQFDTDQSGSIDLHELKHLLARLGYHPTEKERKKLMDAIDTSGDGNIGADEFIAWWVTMHRTKEIETKAAQDGHLLVDVEAAMAATKATDDAAKRAAPLLDLSDISLSSLRNKLVDFRYNWNKGSMDIPPPIDEVPIDYGGPRKFGTVDVSHTHPQIVAVMAALVDDVVLITPLMLPDAAQRIQKMYRAKRARKQLIQTLNDRYVHLRDPATGMGYYMNRLTKEVRFTKPLLLGRREIQTPRTKLREQHADMAMTRRRNWMVSIMAKEKLQSSPTFRTAAFYVYGILCDIKARWKRGVWLALRAQDYTLAQLVVRHYPRQLKKPGPSGDLPLHFAIRHHLDLNVILAFLHGHTDVITKGNTAGYTPLHLACRDYPSAPLLEALLTVPHGLDACQRPTTGSHFTPLHLAVHHNAPLPVLRTLLDACPAALLQRNRRRNTPFHDAITLAATRDTRAVLELCVEYQPNNTPLGSMPVFESAWPLHLALLHDAPDAIVEYIVELAPESVTVPFRQLLPLFMAMKYRRAESLIRLLAEKTQVAGTAPTAMRTPKRFNPVHYALLYRFSSDLVLYFLAMHPDWASDQTIRKETPLHLAAMYCTDVNVAKKLLLIDPLPARHVNFAGYLPLHLAVVRGDIEMVKKLLQVCPWSLLDTIPGTKYDALMLSAKASRRFSNEPIVDALLMPPKLAPKRQKYKPLDLSPYYVASTSHLATMPCFDKLHMLDTCSTDDLEHLARKKMRQAFHKPTAKWELTKIMRLMALNPCDAAIQTRSLLAINEIIRGYDDPTRETVLEKYDIVRTLQHTMYDFTTNPRIQILGQKCLHHLLPTAFAKAKYQSRIDPLYKF
ncbi:Aste57867_15102 [Aphanomyces stellatus]|uniref:Aste57867_15102 protein n=1 Tax=Aphanomyces stellatus TaxID=120398 RepID=A0A485L522_9STRA|nr:hypothetical protein As57867_015046 [Aphanomyces stellatus]VFT91915.1 Aste57867_15102 [Aphanomyces stellatus]